jgi:hypothetical protein
VMEMIFIFILWDLIMNETGDAIRGDEEEE